MASFQAELSKEYRVVERQVDVTIPLCIGFWLAFGHNGSKMSSFTRCNTTRQLEALQALCIEISNPHTSVIELLAREFPLEKSQPHLKSARSLYDPPNAESMELCSVQWLENSHPKNEVHRHLETAPLGAM